jgi:hypothetical protein
MHNYYKRYFRVRVKLNCLTYAPRPQGSVDYKVNSSLVQLHYGTLDSGAQPLLCTTLLAE